MIGVNVGSDIRMLEKMVEDVRREIIDKATRLIPRFMDIAKSLGLDRDDINGLMGLAGELVYSKSASNKKSIKYHGLYKANGRDARRMKRYDSRAQRYLIMLTNAILWKNGELRRLRYRDLRRTLKMVTNIKKQIDLLGRAGI